MEKVSKSRRRRQQQQNINFKATTIIKTKRAKSLNFQQQQENEEKVETQDDLANKQGQQPKQRKILHNWKCGKFKEMQKTTKPRNTQRTYNTNTNTNNDCYSSTTTCAASICAIFNAQTAAAATANLHNSQTLRFDFKEPKLSEPLPLSQLTMAAANSTTTSANNWHETTAINATFFAEFNVSNCYRKFPTQCLTHCSTANVYKLFSYLSLSSYSSFSASFNIGKSYSISNFDLRSFLYVALLILIYCSVLIRASATGSTTTTTTPTIITTGATTPTTSAGLIPKLPIKKNGIVVATTATSVNTNNNNDDDDDNDNASAEFITINLTKIALNENLSLNTAVIEKFNFNSNLSRRLTRRDAANVPDDDDDSSYHDDEYDEYDALINNKSAKGKYIGAPCNDMKCEPTLLHVICDKETLTCGCEKNYPVQLGLTKGCDKPKKLGEQCFYDKTCMYNDENSLCVQVRHNALCQCANGFHSVSYTKPTRRVFCTQDLKELSSDLPTLLGVTTGIAVLAGLICMVLHLFSKTKYPRHRNFGDANIPPPIMYSSDTGIPLTVQSGRPSSRSSLRSSGSIGSYGNRRSSSGGITLGGGGGVGVSGIGGGSKGILVSTSRTGSRRPSLASVHSTSSSVRSYSMMRFEKETQQKEIRQEMKLRLARLQHQQQMSQNKPQIIIGDTLSMLSGGRIGTLEHGASSSSAAAAVTALSRFTMATPSPLTPNSTDELLPSVDELQEYPIKSEILPMTSTKPKETINVAAASLTAVNEIATTSAAAMATAKAKSNVNVNNIEMSSAVNETAATAAATKKLAEAGAYIGPCSSSTEAL